MFNLCWLNINAQINYYWRSLEFIITINPNKIINYLIKHDYKYKFPLNMHKRRDQAITIKSSSNIIIIIIIMLKHNNSKILGMILTRLITNPSMSLSIKNQSFNPNMILTWIKIRKNIGSTILLIILNNKVTLDMVLGIKITI